METFNKQEREDLEKGKITQGEAKFQNNESTIKFIKKIHQLIEVMTPRTPDKSLRAERLDTEGVLRKCPKQEILRNFLDYLDEWEKCGGKSIISSSTWTGLKVTVGSTLELIDYLSQDCNYEFLMTSRLTQDALERWFGIAREACGSNDHPDPILFSTVFRLLSCYSLVKPPKGSNVTGTELLETLMQTKDSLMHQQAKKEHWFARIDKILDNGYGDGDAVEDHERDHLKTHDYDVLKTSKPVLEYMSGYVVRKSSRFTKCPECLDLIESKNEEINRDQDFINFLNRGNLKHPTENLVELITVIEHNILETLGKTGMNIDVMMQILEKLENIKNLPRIGCDQHNKYLAKRVMNFHIVMRGHMMCRSYNLNNSEKQQSTKALRKQSKYNKINLQILTNNHDDWAVQMPQN